jgi:hypothetical protein
MPVSRQRKKGPSKPKSVQQGAKLRKKQEEQQAHERELAELSGAFRSIGEDRRRFDVRRREIAREHAGRLVPELTAIASGEDEAAFEDVVCARLGALMFELGKADEVEDYVNPGQVFEAVLEGAAATVRGALAAIADDPDGWHRPWALFVALARTAFGEWADRARRLESDLRSRPGGGVLPEVIGCAPAGTVLWARDAYGGRFAATAPFPAPEPGGPERWYLWDIDACGVDSFTVYSDYFADPAAALEAWRAGVGTVAGAQAVWTQADDPVLLALLLPRDLGMFEPGGESADQFAEYQRSRRLADETRASLGEFEIPDNDARSRNPKAIEAARRFSAWLGEHRPDTPGNEDRDEAVATLADDWFFQRLPGMLADTCSPHRVALFAEHCKGYYQEEFASRLTALLPDWVTWFAGSTGLPETLTARCLPYAEGAPHPATSEHDGIEMLARVEE